MDDFISMTSLGRFGGFGNQLFQYVALKIYAKENNLKVEVPEDWIGRKLFVNCNDLPALTPREQKMIKPTNKTPIWLNKDLNGCDIKGYFQYHTSFYDKDYFRSLYRFIPTLEESLRKPVEKLKHKIGPGDIADDIAEKTTLIGIHIRLGDYRILGRSANITPTEWYLKWLQKNWGKLDNPVLFVASDEIDDVIGNFREYKPNAFKGDNFLCDFYVLEHCDYLLISNSTFSFTAAMLNGEGKFYRPDFKQKEMVSFNPWDAEPLGVVFPEDELVTEAIK